MLKKMFCVLFSAVIVLLSFCACSKNKEINVIYPIACDPECLDPQIAESDESVLIIRNCMEGIVRAGENGEILPGVAESWDISPDKKTYTFHIRKDAKWQMLRAHKDVLGEDYESSFDNSVTAYDCAFGIIRALRPETKAKNAKLLYCIQNAQSFNLGEISENEVGVYAADSRTFAVHLERANDDFLRVLTYPCCMPCSRDFFEATGAKYGLELKYTLCNGPFYVGSWVDDNSLTLYKSEVYSGDSVSGITSLYFNVNSDSSQIVSKFNSGDYNSIPVDTSYKKDINASNSIKYYENISGVSGLAFNLKDSALSNDKVRQALVCATDLLLIEDNGNVSNGLIPPSCRWGDKPYRDAAGDFNFPDNDDSEIKDVFYDGLKELDITNINITIICPENRRNDIVRIIQNWQKLFGFSITVTTSVMQEDKIKTAVSKGEFQIAFVSLQTNDRSPLILLENFLSENSDNYYGFADDDYDELIEKCYNEFDGGEILEGIKNAENIIVSQGIFYPMYNQKTYFAYRDEIGIPYGVSNVKDIDFSARVKNEN